MIRRIFAMLVVVGLLVGLIAYSQQRQIPPKSSGFIEADEIRLGSRVGGRVARVLVEEGQQVHKGDTLIELEPFDLVERQRQAEAELAARQAELDRMTAGFRAEEVAQALAKVQSLEAKLELLQAGPRQQEIAAAQAYVEVAESTLHLAQQNYDRVIKLAERDATTQEQIDRAQDQLQAARAMRTVRQQEVSLLEEGSRAEEIRQAEAQLEEARQAYELAKNGNRPEDIAAARAARDAAQSAVEALEVQKDELAITAPADGYIDALELQPGDLTTPGAPVVSIVVDSRMWVRAYVPQNRMDLQVGQSLQVSVDAWPDERFEGELTFISRQAEFTPSNVQTSEERAKQVFRIKVMLKDGLDRLHPGMAADVWLGPELAR